MCQVKEFRENHVTPLRKMHMSTDTQKLTNGFRGFLEPKKPNHGHHGDEEWLTSTCSREILSRFATETEPVWRAAWKLVLG